MLDKGLLVLDRGFQRKAPRQRNGPSKTPTLNAIASDSEARDLFGRFFLIVEVSVDDPEVLFRCMQYALDGGAPLPEFALHLLSRLMHSDRGGEVVEKLCFF